MIIFAYAFVIYYLTHILLFDEQQAGPFASQKERLAWSSTDDSGERHLFKRPIAIFDRFRWGFGLYSISRDPDGQAIWTLREERLAVWRCPHCLGFWVALFVALLSLLWYPEPESFFLTWFAGAGINSFLVRMHESRYSLPR